MAFVFTIVEAEVDAALSRSDKEQEERKREDRGNKKSEGWEELEGKCSLF